MGVEPETDRIPFPQIRDFPSDRRRAGGLIDGCAKQHPTDYEPTAIRRNSVRERRHCRVERIVPRDEPHARRKTRSDCSFIHRTFQHWRRAAFCVFAILCLLVLCPGTLAGEPPLSGSVPAAGDNQAASSQSIEQASFSPGEAAGSNAAVPPLPAGASSNIPAPLTTPALSKQNVPPAPAAASAALIDMNKKPISEDGSATSWASFDPLLSQGLPPDPDAPPQPNEIEKPKSNGDEKKDECLQIKDDETCKLLPPGWNFHAQTTLIEDFQPGFGALYSGPNSLGTARDRQGTITADLFLGAPLWQGAEFHADLLMWQGFGLTNSFGLEAFPNADAYKAGTDTPRFMFSHFFIRQTFGLGGEQEDVPDGQFTLPGKRDISRLTITAGRLNMAELFDQNTYNHDPHSQFMSWASTMLSWDYAADTIGYTTGLAFELNQPDWALRYGWFQLPGLPNGYTADDRIFMWPVESGEITSDGNFWKQWGMITELERRWHVEDHPGAIRLQAWIDHGFLADYNAATTLLLRFASASECPARSGNNRSSGRLQLPFQIRVRGEHRTRGYEERRRVLADWLARRRNRGGGLQRRRLDLPARR